MRSDDVSAIVAFDSQIGLMWGSQYDESGMAGYHFAIHEDGHPDEEWRSDNPVLKSTMSNDHINLKADSEGRLFAATKTRFDRIKRDLDKPYIVLWVRDQKGRLDQPSVRHGGRFPHAYFCADRRRAS